MSDPEFDDDGDEWEPENPINFPEHGDEAEESTFDVKRSATAEDFPPADYGEDDDEVNEEDDDEDSFVAEGDDGYIELGGES